MLPPPGLYKMASAQVTELLDQLDPSDSSVFMLSGNIDSVQALFASIWESIPLDPPLLSDRSWDALSDSLWEGLRQLNCGKVVVLWPNSERLAMSSPEAYEVAIDILSDIPLTPFDAVTTSGVPKHVVFVLTVDPG